MFKIDRRHAEQMRSPQPHLLIIPGNKKEETEEIAEIEAQEAQTDTAAEEAESVVTKTAAETARPEEAASEPVVVDTESIRREAQAKADELIRQTQAHCDELRNQAQEQCDELKNQAWQEGYSQGKAEAREELKQQRMVQKEELCGLIERVQEERNRLLDEVQDDVVRLAVDIARKILQHELDYGDESFVSLVRHAIIQMKAEGRVVVRVSPQEYARYFSEDGARQFNTDNMSVTVMEDNYLERGGCIIESEGETINASVESQLKTIAIGFGRQVG